MYIIILQMFSNVPNRLQIHVVNSLLVPFHGHLKLKFITGSAEANKQLYINHKFMQTHAQFPD
jgi:hypothetical protein